MSSESFLPPGARNQTDVFAVHGADPEVLAYAMAKYSRSALSMRESLTEISAQRAEQFLNTFYFQYGHRSIADLAHIAFAVERLSLLAAIVLVDEQRWDGQERSTRYQNFLKSGWYFPDFGTDSASAQLYAKTIENLFAAYQRTTAAVLEALRRRVRLPGGAEARGLRAHPQGPRLRRGPLPAAAGHQHLARPDCERPHAGNPGLAPALPPRRRGARPGRQAARSRHRPRLERERPGRRRRWSRSSPLQTRRWPTKPPHLLTREVRTAPTLVKYAQPNDYEIQTRAELAQAAAELLKGMPIAAAPVVDLVERTEILEVELAATLLYSASHHPYRQIRDLVAGLPEARVIGDRRAGPAPPRPPRRSSARLPRRSRSALRHPHGHRRLPRHAPPSPLHADHSALHRAARLRDARPPAISAGDVNILAEAGVLADYQSAIEAAHAASAQIAASPAPEAAQSALYLLPLATRIRCLFKMDFAEAQYISELRSGPAGHFSYRRVAWEMFMALERQHPSLAKHIRVTDFTQPIDLLQR